MTTPNKGNLGIAPSAIQPRPRPATSIGFKDAEHVNRKEVLRERSAQTSQREELRGLERKSERRVLH